jgi:hypothetical protein
MLLGYNAELIVKRVFFSFVQLQWLSKYPNCKIFTVAVCK